MGVRILRTMDDVLDALRELERRRERIDTPENSGGREESSGASAATQERTPRVVEVIDGEFGDH